MQKYAPLFGSLSLIHILKILLKILVAPFALALSLLAALLVFLFDICAVLLTIASVILAVLGLSLIHILYAAQVLDRGVLPLLP